MNEYTIRTGKEVLLEILPVDPRDLLRGDYVVLNYKINRLPQRNKYNHDQKVYAILKIDDKNIANIDFISTTIPEENRLFIKGKVHHNSIIYGIESYFVKEKTGLELQRKLRKGAYAKTVIDKNGKAKVKELVY